MRAGSDVARVDGSRHRSWNVLSEHACFGGIQGFCAHDSTECAARCGSRCTSRRRRRHGRVPVLYYLAGPHLHRGDLHDQGGRAAARGRARPDAGRAGHQPARLRLPGDDAELGLRPRRRLLRRRDEAPWSAHYRMYSYVTRELPALIAREFPAPTRSRQGIIGHSMGGHGALVWRCATPASTGRSRRSRRSSRRRRCRGARRRSAATSARIATPGATTTPRSWCAGAARRRRS